MSETPAKKPKLDATPAASETDNAIIELELCHSLLDKINEEENEEVIELDRKYKQLRQKCYDKRNKVIGKIPDFWFTVFTGHPDLCNVLSEEDEECLHFLHQLEVDMADNNSGYCMKFHFKPNPYFRNATLTKGISFKHDKMTSESTPIEWSKGKEAAKRDADSFLGWFANNADPSNDKIAEIIKDDIWANTLQYYLPDHEAESEEETNESSEGEEDEANGDKTGDGTSSN